MGTLADLPTRLNVVYADLQAKGNATAIKVAQAIEDDLVAETPVDTSQALSNWQASLDSPALASAFLPPYVKGSHGSTQAESAEAARMAAEAVFARKTPGQPLYLSNVTPYIVFLNDGTERMAPRGFVERAVLIGRSIVRAGG